MYSVFLCTITEYKFSKFHMRRFCNLIGSHNLSSALQFYIKKNKLLMQFQLLSSKCALVKTGLVFLPSALLMNRAIALFPHETRKSPISWLKACFTQPRVFAICVADDSMEQMHLLLNRVIIWNVGD